MAKDIANEIVSFLQRSNAALLLHRSYNHQEGLAVRAANNGFMLKVYGGSTHNTCVDLNRGGEIFFDTARDTAHQIYAILKLMHHDHRGLGLFYTPIPYVEKMPETMCFVKNLQLRGSTCDLDIFKLAAVVEMLVPFLETLSTVKMG